jgi:hypothetical protein
LSHLVLPPGVLEEVRSGEVKLAGLPVPAGLSPAIETEVKQSIAEAFVFGFRVVMLICAALSVAGSVLAWLMIPNATQTNAESSALLNRRKEAAA